MNSKSENASQNFLSVRSKIERESWSKDVSFICTCFYIFLRITPAVPLLHGVSLLDRSGSVTPFNVASGTSSSIAPR